MKYSRLFYLLLTFVLFQRCVDPIEPSYDFETDFILVEGLILDQPGLSEVRITRSEIFLDNYTLVPIEGLRVVSVDEDGNEEEWTRIENTSKYRPAEDFAAETGRAYYLRITTPEGRTIESSPEIMPDPVPIQSAELRFEQEAYFNDNLNRFIPAFRLLVDLQDPPDERNYFQWQFRSFSSLEICASCRRSVYRNGECIETPESRFVNRYDYQCDVACWVETKSSSLNILSDEFSQGRLIENIETGRIDFQQRGGLLTEVQQYSTTKAQFDYNSILKNLSDNSGGLNSTLPANLIGNLKDVNNSDIDVLGFVGSAAVVTNRIYIDRDTTSGAPLPNPNGVPIYEPLIPAPPRAPCEGGSRSRIRPVGWPE